MTIGDILGHEESMLKIWIDERRSRDVNASLMWENLKLFSVLIPTIITVGTIFLRVALDPSLTKYTDQLLLGSLVFPSLVILLSACGIIDLHRRWKRTLEAIAHLLKLEALLGLHEYYEGKVLRRDKHLFERYYRDTKCIKTEKDATTGKDIKTQVDIETEDEFIKRNIRKSNMFTVMLAVYIILIVMGIFLLYLIVSLYMMN
jgi:hypothetical protein